MVFKIFLIHLLKEILHQRNAVAGKVQTLQNEKGPKKVKMHQYIKEIKPKS